MKTQYKCGACNKLCLSEASLRSHINASARYETEKNKEERPHLELKAKLYPKGKKRSRSGSAKNAGEVRVSEERRSLHKAIRCAAVESIVNSMYPRGWWWKKFSPYHRAKLKKDRKEFRQMLMSGGIDVIVSSISSALKGKL